MAFSVIAIVSTLVLSFNSEKRDIAIASYQYKAVHSEQFADQLTNQMIKDFQEEKANTIISTIILEIGMVFSYFSLIPYQKKLIERYNEF